MSGEPLDEFSEGQWWIVELDGLYNATPDQKRAVAVVHNLIKAAKQRELELLAVIEKLKNNCAIVDEELTTRALSSGFKDMPRISVYSLDKLREAKVIEPPQALREHEAKMANEILDAFQFFKSAEGLWLADAIAVWVEERRTK